MPAWQTILPALRVKGLFKDSSSTSCPQVLLSFTWRGCLYLNKFWKIPLESPSFLSGTGQWLCQYTLGMLTSFKIASIICFDSTSDMIHAQENLNQLQFFCYHSWCFVHSKDKGASLYTLLRRKIFWLEISESTTFGVSVAFFTFVFIVYPSLGLASTPPLQQGDLRYMTDTYSVFNEDSFLSSEEKESIAKVCDLYPSQLVSNNKKEA